jgi:hypothetical protein
MVQPAASDRVADNKRRRLIADVQKARVAADGARRFRRFVEHKLHTRRDKTR